MSEKKDEGWAPLIPFLILLQGLMLFTMLYYFNQGSIGKIKYDELTTSLTVLQIILVFGGIFAWVNIRAKVAAETREMVQDVAETKFAAEAPKLTSTVVTEYLDTLGLDRQTILLLTEIAADKRFSEAPDALGEDPEGEGVRGLGAATESTASSIPDAEPVGDVSEHSDAKNGEDNGNAS